MQYRNCLSMTAICFMLSFFGLASPSFAATGPIPGGPRIADCSKAKDPGRCQARIAARSACKDKRGDSKRICMEAYVIAPNCARADNPKRCIAQQRAETACQGKVGKTYKTCVRSKLKQKGNP
jgi:hypothetical protein